MHTFLNQYDLANFLQTHNDNNNDDNNVVVDVDCSSYSLLDPGFKSKARISMRLHATTTDVTLDSSTMESESDSDYAAKNELATARKDKFLQIIEHLNHGLVEREEESRLVLLSVLCRYFLLLLWQPGTA